MKIIIAGARAIGTYLAKLLSRTNENITIIDEDEECLDEISAEYDVLTMQASPVSIEALRTVGVRSCDLFIAVTLSQDMNIEACSMAKAMGAKKTVAKVEEFELANPDNAELLQRMGVDSVIYPELLAAKDIINGLKMSWVRQRWDVHNGALVMLGIKLRETAEILNRPLKELCGPNDPYHIVAIKRGNDTIIPGGNDELKLNDIAYFMTKRNHIPLIRKIVGKEKYADVKNVMVMGGGKTAVRTAVTMPEYMDMKIIEMDGERCEALNDLLIDTNHTMVIHGDGRDVSLLLDEGIKSCQAFVAVTGNAETNILACLTAKRMGVRKTVALVENLDYAEMAESLDIGTIINKKAIAASHIYEMMLDTEVANVRFLMSANADVAEFVAHPDSKVTRKKVFELGIPYGMTLGGLVRNGEGILISGGTQIQAGDIVVVFSHNADLKRIEKFFV
ncbi:MAG: Trk system potassium transporter TrkA [Prevotella sp.]|nr:Trk system potassium transporter TrkA [Prevotella sp.]